MQQPLQGHIRHDHKKMVPVENNRLQHLLLDPERLGNDFQARQLARLGDDAAGFGNGSRQQMLSGLKGDTHDVQLVIDIYGYWFRIKHCRQHRKQ